MISSSSAANATMKIERPARRFDVALARNHFPAIQQSVQQKPLVYLDSAATALKPQAVLDAIVDVYTRDCANVHRAIHTLAQRATERFENARKVVQRFVGANSESEIIWVRGATEGINLIAQAFLRPQLQEDDEIVVTELEHHANIVPWQLLATQCNARLRVVPVREGGTIATDDVESVLSPRTKMVAFAHISNVYGTILPVREITSLCRRRGIPTLVDGAQAVPHLQVDVKELDCDFYVFSGHKLYGPTGIGVLYGRKELLESMPPYQGGGEMIDEVRFTGTTFNQVPLRFEAGTPNIAGAVGLAAAIQYLQGWHRPSLFAHEEEVFHYAEERLQEIKGLQLLGRAAKRTAVLSFTVDNVHPSDLAMLLDAQGIALRAGHHCAQPLFEQLGTSGAVRASLGLYNTREEIDRLCEALVQACSILR